MKQSVDLFISPLVSVSLIAGGEREKGELELVSVELGCSELYS